MSLQSELTRLQANVTSILSSKDDIMAALASKGVTVPSGATLHDVPSLIAQIDGMAPSTSVEIGGRTYPVVKIGNLYWIAHNLDYVWNGLTVGSSTSSSEQRGNYFNDDEPTYGWNGRKFGLLYNTPAIEYLDNILTGGWRVATSSDWDSLISSSGSTPQVASDNLRSDSMPWYTQGQGNNSLGMNMLLSGARGVNGNYVSGGGNVDEGYYNGSNLYIYDLYPTGFVSYYDGRRASQKSVRLCRDA